MKANEAQEKAGLQAEIDELVKSDAHSAAMLAQRKVAAKAAVNAAREELRRVADNNPVYRVAASWFRTSQLTQEQFAIARWWFATVSAVAIALTGSAAAFVHYARAVVPGSTASFGVQIAKVARARRAYLARKRKAVIREVPVFKDGKEYIFRDGKEVVVEQVVRYVDRIVLIPHWGSGLVRYINALWWNGQTRPVQEQPANDNNISADKKVQ